MSKIKVTKAKTMEIPDDLIIKYFELATDIHPDKINEMKANLESDSVNPRDVKMSLAKEIVRLYHSEEDSLKAEHHFVHVFQKNQMPEDLEPVKITDTMNFIEVIVYAKLASSNSEARRLITQGGVRINGEKVNDFNDVKLKDEDIIQVGKKKFAKIKL